MRFNLISNSIKRRHNKINTHVMYLIHSSQKTKLYLKQIPNGHDEMATRGRWFLGQYSPKLTSAFDFSSAFVLRYHFFPHFRVFSRKGESGICLFHVNQCICGRCDSWSRKFWEFDRPIIIKDRYHLRNTSFSPVPGWGSYSQWKSDGICQWFLNQEIPLNTNILGVKL